MIPVVDRVLILGAGDVVVQGIMSSEGIGYHVIWMVYGIMSPMGSRVCMLLVSIITSVVTPIILSTHITTALAH